MSGVAAGRTGWILRKEWVTTVASTCDWTDSMNRLDGECGWPKLGTMRKNPSTRQFNRPRIYRVTVVDSVFSHALCKNSYAFTANFVERYDKSKCSRRFLWRIFKCIITPCGQVRSEPQTAHRSILAGNLGPRFQVAGKHLACHRASCHTADSYEKSSACNAFSYHETKAHNAFPY